MNRHPENGGHLPISREPEQLASAWDDDDLLWVKEVAASRRRVMLDRLGYVPGEPLAREDDDPTWFIKKWDRDVEWERINQRFERRRRRIAEKLDGLTDKDLDLESFEDDLIDEELDSDPFDDELMFEIRGDRGTVDLPDAALGRSSESAPNDAAACGTVRRDAVGEQTEVAAKLASLEIMPRVEPERDGVDCSASGGFRLLLTTTCPLRRERFGSGRLRLILTTHRPLPLPRLLDWFGAAEGVDHAASLAVMAGRIEQIRDVRARAVLRIKLRKACRDLRALCRRGLGGTKSRFAARTSSASPRSIRIETAGGKTGRHVPLN